MNDQVDKREEYIEIGEDFIEADVTRLNQLFDTRYSNNDKSVKYMKNLAGIIFSLQPQRYDGRRAMDIPRFLRYNPVSIFYRLHIFIDTYPPYIMNSLFLSEISRDDYYEK